VWRRWLDTSDVATQTAIVAALLLGPAILSGVAFPLAIRMVVLRPAMAGSGVGRMTALNTFGGIFGSLAIAFVVLPAIGLQSALLLTTGLSLAIGWIAWEALDPSLRPRVRYPAMALSLLVWVAIPVASGTRLPQDFLALDRTLLDFEAADSAFFSYWRPVAGTLTRVAAARLPFYWDSVAMDSVTSVGIRATGFYRERTTGNETLRTVNWRTEVPNAEGRTATGCAAAPAAPEDVDAIPYTNTGVYRVALTWDRSGDDGAGGDDVRSYLVERQRAFSPWETLAAVPATGALSYAWTHYLPGDGNYLYGVRAMNCGDIPSSRDIDAAGVLP
jgi:hypothetical protein